MGHTHEDIDAFFGVYSKHLDKLDVYTVLGKESQFILSLFNYCCTLCQAAGEMSTKRCFAGWICLWAVFIYLFIYFTVQRTQPGPPNIDQPITGHVYNKGVWLW